MRKNRRNAAVWAVLAAIGRLPPQSLYIQINNISAPLKPCVQFIFFTNINLYSYFPNNPFSFGKIYGSTEFRVNCRNAALLWRR